MKFSNLFSLLLASIAIASPIAYPEAEAAETTELTTRATTTYDDSWAYKQAIAAHAGLAKDSWYYFTLEWPLGSLPLPGNKETAADMAAVRKEYGFDHIGIVSGQVTETPGIGPNKNTIKRDFKGFVYHMVMNDDVKKTTEMVSKTFIENNYGTKGLNLKWGGQTSKNKDGKAKTTAKDYIEADPSHKIWAAKTNDCYTFVKAVKAVL